MDKEKLVKLLLSAKNAYYNDSEPIMTDAEYDRLEENLREIDPDNSFFRMVGTLLPGESGKITHSIPMLSMAKVKNIPDFLKWYEKISPGGISLCLQPKIDGLSASCRYQEGKLILIATRGDGLTGQDISHIRRYMNDFPENIPEGLTCEIRGELYLPRDTAFDTGGRPLRNNCVGLINRKENREDLKYVRFIAYQIAGNVPLPFATESSKIDFLAKNGFNIIPYKICIDTDEAADYYHNYLAVYRDNWLFETDGLIAVVNDCPLHEEIDSRWVVDHHHHYAIAIKPPAQIKKSVLIDIEWNVSRQGNLIPVALFKPVFIGGAQLQRASLHNAQFVRQLGLKKGDMLEIERANDVIPHIRENLNREKMKPTNLVPVSCPFCHKPLEENGVHVRCTNQSCDEKNIQRILFWVREIGMEQIAEQTVRFLYGRSIVRSIRDLYSLDSGRLKGLEGFAEKKTANILSTINANRTITTGEFISKLGIPLVQKKALKKLGIYTIKDFIRFDNDEYITGKNIIEWKNDPNNMALFNELRETLSILDEAPPGESAGTVCMTGTGPAGRKELTEILERRGFIFSDSVSKETDILICEDPQANSSKLQKARKLDIQITSYRDFFPEFYRK